ncbi:response regulator transcription factor [Pseudoflavonifractor sp. DSM 107456]|uniref:Stage 0 sporulation protein A homolog n=2 Tax=Pseudoflavonifractor TaxID=1017280 RepID=A0ABR9RAS9_9FIRM|nr:MULTISPECIES: response regulator transcription factor [Pseudoflavonifractor]MBC5730548.1 response regulator transcription factor [Pseudoflavonifractor hominis]MBE5055663.1 response regulator transcription factor [Pseudoflavonifractor gallinarum]MBS5133847.1 response regulator transcription factor [Oscillospiraceae bacterium]
MGHTIFLVEDEAGIRQELSALLSRYGYRCVTTADFEDVAGQVCASGADLLLLDLNLPRYDGYHVCREVRRRSQMPIIVVTSRATELDELMSMNLGADDFLTKPYNTQILLARMARLLQRACPGVSPAVSRGGLTLDLGRGVAARNGVEVELTRNESRILQTLLAAEGRIVSRNALMEALWKSDAFVDDNTLTVNVARLRRRLEELGLSEVLATRRGQGYQLCL